MNILELSEQEINRRNSLNELRAMGIDPYPAAEYVVNAYSTDIKDTFDDQVELRKSVHRRTYDEPSCHGQSFIHRAARFQRTYPSVYYP